MIMKRIAGLRYHALNAPGVKTREEINAIMKNVENILNWTVELHDVHDHIEKLQSERARGER